MFEPPFWIALFEHFENESYSVARQVIGTSEPQGADLVGFFNNLNYSELKFSQPDFNESASKKEYSFKKQQHKVKLTLSQACTKHTYTKAHAILKNQHSEIKAERKKQSRVERQNTIKQQFMLHQQKKKKKHRGH